MDGVVISPQNFTSFGELLRYLRERVELSQKELALQVGYHYSYMCRIEKNQRMPDTHTLMTRFVPALLLDQEPQWTARLLELAGGSEEKKSPAVVPSVEAKPASLRPPTALPIFDLSASKLPIFLTPLLGRDKEVIALANLISRNDVRLVTVIGPPGVGKTRLAAHLAAQLAGAFAHGPLFVDMTPITHSREFLPVLAQALGVLESSDAPIIRNIIAALRQRNMLLVIDNFEQIIQAATVLPSLLMGAPNIKILATSREALHVSGEYEFPLTPFPIPHEVRVSHNMDENLDGLLQYPSVRLFVQRAQAVQPGFKLTSENGAAIVEICQQLDGLPLAIELAAARAKAFTPQSMLQQLNRRLEWLTRGSRDSLKQTLRGAIDWSYNLFSDQERTILRRMSVFVDGCTLRAAESICADGEYAETSVRRADVLDLIVKLIDKSLVTTEAVNQQVRYHLLETVAEFGREKLSQAGELDEICARHLIHFTEYAEESESQLDGTNQGPWIRITVNEHGNFHAAMDYALSHQNVLEYGLRICAAISLFWLERSHFQEGLARLNQMLELAVAPEHRHIRAKMLYRCGAIQARAFNFNTAHKLCEQSIEIARTLEDKRILTSALFYLGEICTEIKDYQKARALLEESVAICRKYQLPTQLSIALTDLSKVLLEQGDAEQALTTVQEALEIAESVNNIWGLSHVLQSQGLLHRFIREYDEAIAYFERCLPYTREIGDRFAEGIALSNLSILYNLQEDYPASGHAAEQSFIAFQTIGDEVQQPFPLRMMGYSAIKAGNIVRARNLIRDSLKGNRGQDHLPGQLACLVAIGACELAQGNLEKATTYAALVENRLNAEAISFLEPDAIALSNLITTGKNKLGGKSFKQIVEKSKSMRAEDMIDSELTVAA